MKIAATPATATLAGVCTAAGLGAFEVWEQNHPLEVVANRLLLVAAVVVFFFGPVFLFVAGPLQRRFGVRHIFTQQYWADVPHVCVRALCWFLGAAAYTVL
jgi:hypothetical protein